MHYLQRKYVDLIREVSSKWVNWDPPIPVEVGAFGDVDRDTGELIVDGNIYHPDFQAELDTLGLSLRIANHPPQQGGIEDDFIIASKGARRIDLHFKPHVDIAGLATASIQGQWQFEHGKRDALLIMHSPRQHFIPPNVLLDTLYRVPKLKNKWLVTSVHTCPAFSMYLSNMSGEKLALALVAQLPVAAAAGATVGASTGLAWWSDVQADLLRKASDKSGEFSYTPLYTLKRKMGWFKRAFRDSDEDLEVADPREAAMAEAVAAGASNAVSGDALWVDVTPPWEPLDEDGAEDSINLDEDDDDDD
ncbi:hypothetical protein JVU11DRAFT_7098 [Chiua virens]|nr:hypothetical protein JVU11DRAFT_7098 [Chiua virens]